MRTLARPADKADLVRRLRLVRPDSRRRWGRMTVHQMVCHVTDAFRMGTGTRAVRIDANPFTGTVLKGIALYVPVPWLPGIRTSPEIDPLEGGTPPGDFATDLAEAETQLERFVAAAALLDRIPHPLFGRMSCSAWLRWGYLHVDHHLRQFGA
jgi:DinB family protein